MADFSQAVVASAREFDREAAPLKTRVHALAKQLGMTSKEMIETLGHAGIVVKAASSTVNQNQLDAVLNLIVSSSEKPLSDASNDTKRKSEQKPDQDSPEQSEENQAASEQSEQAEDKPKNKPKKATRKRAVKKATAKKSTDKKTATKKSSEKPVEPVADIASSDDAQEVQAAPESQESREVEDSKPKRRRRVRRVTRTSSPKNSEAAETAANTESVASTETTAAAETSAAAESQDDPKTSVVEEALQASVAEAAAQASPEQAAEVAPEAVVAAAPLFIAPHAVTADELRAASASEVQDGEENTVEAEEEERQPRPRRRRRGRGRRRVEVRRAVDAQEEENSDVEASASERKSDGQKTEQKSSSHSSRQPESKNDDAAEDAPIEEPQAIRGSTRLEAQRRRRNERREQSRKRHVLSEAEFLARRESVERTMVVRERQRHDHAGIVTEVGVLEDDLLVEHFVTSDTQTTQIGNVYLGRVQNVLPSMEAAFVDIGTDRNAVIYVGDLNWKLMGIKGRSRKIEQVLKSGDQILVQVTKDPIGHKGARLTTHISLAGRFLVYVPGGRSAGISRKLPETERKRLKEILREVTPEGSGTIIRTAAEGVSKEAIEADVLRLEKLWNKIWDESEKAKARKGAKPIALYEEPDMLVKVVRDVFNEDFTRLVVEGDRPWNTVTDYIGDLAPELESRLQRYFPNQHGGEDVFAHFRIDEQLAKALDRKVWLPSGGTLVIDRTEAMTVIDVNTGKFTGSGGNLEETVTRNNLEAAEEIVRQMRLRDLGGMIVVDFIDMVLPENQDLVLRRLKEALGRDRTRHEVSEVTSLGLVQMTRKRLGTGLLETFSTPCCCCGGRGIKIHIDPVEHDKHSNDHGHGGHSGQGKRTDRKKKSHDPQKHPAAVAMHKDEHQDGRQGSADSSVREDEGVEKQLTEAEASEKRVADAVDALVVASEKEEPRPPQRRRRNERRGAVRKGNHPEDNRTRRGQRESDEDTDLAALAAAAVAEAREKDPEEPSDDRYVSEHSSRRRRRAVRTNRHARDGEMNAPRRVDAHASSRSNERGVADATEAKDRSASTQAKEAEQSSARTGRSEHAERESVTGGRRGRRGVRRVRRVRRVAEPEQAAEAHVSETKRKPLEEFQTYEKALAEFEASPRRRRPTRGKSRSDREPRREDFEAQRPRSANGKSADTTESDNRTAEAGSSRVKDSSVTRVEASQSGRRRRRAVRRTTRPQTEAASRSQSAPAGKGTANAKQRHKPAAAEANSGGADGVVKRTVRKRGGRRAVRRTSRPSQIK